MSLDFYRDPFGRLCVLLLALVVAAGCQVVERPQFVYTGPIDDKAVATLERELKPGDGPLEISSAGGHTRSGIAIGRLLRSRGIRVIVRDRCMTACALHVLAGAQKVQVLPGALIAFHGSAEGFASIAGNVAPPHIKAELNRMATEERVFLQDMGVSHDAAIYASGGRMPRCVLVANDGQSTDDIYVEWGWKLWIPSKKLMKAMGYRITGYWPRRPKDVAGMIAREFPGRGMGIAFWPDRIPESAKQMLEKLRSVPECKNPIVAGVR